jgi:subtilisin family serine protease
MQADGESLKASYLGVSAKVGSIDGYGYLGGTSMAAPHVVGAAALIWRACNSCTSTQVAQCLEDTAMDLGTTGRDDQFGHGLVRTENAYLCLINDIGCCSEQKN